MHYMVVERYKFGPEPVYQRFNALGRMAPEGVTYVSSWVDQRLDRCFQVMETADPQLLQQWVAAWSDIVDFEIVPVVSSAEAAAQATAGVPPARTR